MKDNENTFATACIKNNISTLDTEAKCEKAKLIAKQSNIEKYNDVNYLQAIISEYISQEKNKQIEKIKQQRSKEKERENSIKIQLERYADLRGREKNIRQLEDSMSAEKLIIKKYDEAQESARVIKDTYRALGLSLETAKPQPKQDWAIAGGIASALAGTAAGIAVASDIQRKNADSAIDISKAKEEAERTRESWRKTGDTLAREVLAKSEVSYEDYREAKRRLSELTRAKESYEVFLTDEKHDRYGLLNTLHPTVSSITVTESGSVHITVSIKGGSYIIYDSVLAVIDG